MEKSREGDSIDKFIKKISINNVEIVAFIDCGSAVCTIRNDIVEKLGVVTIPCHTVLYGFGQNAPVLTTHMKIAKEITLDNVTAKVDVFVVPKNAQEVDVILGRTFTEQTHLAYYRVGDQLVFGYSETQPFCDFPEADKQGKHIQITKGQVIRKNHINVIQAEIKDHKALYVPILTTTDHDIDISEQNIKLRGDQEYTVQAVSDCERISKEMLNVDKHTPHEHVEDLLNLVNQYRSIFALTLKEIGCTDLITMDIVDNDIPVRHKPYKNSYEDRQEIKRQVGELKQLGIVKETNSQYASPVLLVGKKNGGKRLVVDFRKLNQQTIKQNFPIPQIDEQFEGLSGCTLFSTLDLTSGYLQVPLTEKAQEKTAFITNDDTGQFTKMVFGLTNAPYEFSRLMNLVLGDLKNKICVNFLDDVLIPARDWQQMLERLEMVFEAFQKAKLTLNLGKCVFGSNTVTYLGFELSEKGILPGKGKMTAIEDYPKPRNAHEVRRFLGLTGFFRRFVERYAVIARPLADLTGKDRSFEWGKKEEQAFRELKDKLLHAPALQLYSRSAETELHTDASSIGIAGMLLQKGDDNKMHLVYCVSKKNTEAEQKYHSYRTELLAIVWSVERLRAMLLGIHFIIYTDCQALVYLNAHRMKPQLARWYAILMEYDFEIRHRKGEKMAHVDALSRAPVGEMEHLNLGVYSLLEEHDKVLMIQRNDESISTLIDILRKNSEDRSQEERNKVQNYELDNGRLYRKVEVKGEQRLLYVIPPNMRKSIVVKYHNQMGHFSVDRTVQKILETCWFKGMRRYVRRHIHGCFECATEKTPGGKRPGPLHLVDPPSRPMERVHADHLGPFIKSTRGNSYILVFVDALTKFVTLYPVRSTTSKEAAMVFKHFIDRYGSPKVIVTDRGTAFTADEFEEFCSKRGIKHHLTSSKWAQANGQVERVNRTLVPVITTSLEYEEEWDSKIKEVERNLNLAVNQTTGKSPYRCLLGYTPRFQDAKFANEVVIEEYQRPEILQEEILKEIKEKQKKWKFRYDKKKCYEQLSVGDIVMVKRSPEATGQPTKTQSKYKGPYVIISDLGCNIYKVKTLDETVRQYTMNVHISHLKIYKNAIEEDVSAEEEDEDQEGKEENEEEYKSDQTEEYSDQEEKREESDFCVETDEEEDPYEHEEMEKEKRPRRSRKIPARYQDFVLEENLYFNLFIFFLLCFSFQYHFEDKILSGRPIVIDI